jgi:hypothetical protein
MSMLYTYIVHHILRSSWLRSALLVASICLLSPPAWALLPPWALGALAIGLIALAWAALEACYR